MAQGILRRLKRESYGSPARDHSAVRFVRRYRRAVRVAAGGAGAAPPPPFVLVANHLSYLDVVVLAAQTDCRFIAKLDVSSWPLVGLLCRTVGTIFVDRENRRDLVRVNAATGRAIREGVGVVLF